MKNIEKVKKKSNDSNKGLNVSRRKGVEKNSVLKFHKGINNKKFSGMGHVQILSVKGKKLYLP